VTVTKLVAVGVYWRRGQVHWPVAARLLLGGAPAALRPGRRRRKA